MKKHNIEPVCVNVQHSRDFYKGASFAIRGEWTTTQKYVHDDFYTDFISLEGSVLFCKKTHVSVPDNKPTLIKEANGQVTGIEESPYWTFVSAIEMIPKPLTVSLHAQPGQFRRAEGPITVFASVYEDNVNITSEVTSYLWTVVADGGSSTEVVTTEPQMTIENDTFIDHASVKCDVMYTYKSATSQLTLTDVNDGSTVSMHLISNHSTIQTEVVENVDSVLESTFAPDWSEDTLIITPILHLNGVVGNIVQEAENIVWKINGVPVVQNGDVTIKQWRQIPTLNISKNMADSAMLISFECDYKFPDATSIKAYAEIQFTKLVSKSIIFWSHAVTPNGNVFRNESVTSLPIECIARDRNSVVTAEHTWFMYVPDIGWEPLTNFWDDGTIGSDNASGASQFVPSNAGAILDIPKGLVSTTFTPTDGIMTLVFPELGGDPVLEPGDYAYDPDYDPDQVPEIPQDPEDVVIPEPASQDIRSNTKSFKCVSTYLIDGVTYVATDYTSLISIEDPYLVKVVASNGTVLNPRLESTTLTAVLYQANEIIDAGRYKCEWTQHNLMTGEITILEETSNTLTVAGTQITSTYYVNIIL